MLVQSLACKRAELFGVLTETVSPGFFIVEGQQDLRGDRILFLRREALDALQRLFQQAGRVFIITRRFFLPQFPVFSAITFSNLCALSYCGSPAGIVSRTALAFA